MENENEFLKELSDLVKKYELKHAVFVAENNEDKMCGYFALEKFGTGATIEDTLKCGMNVARLYQSAREKIFYTMDKVTKS